jgi:hypothetical protein
MVVRVVAEKKVFFGSHQTLWNWWHGLEPPDCVMQTHPVTLWHLWWRWF